MLAPAIKTPYIPVARGQGPRVPSEGPVPPPELRRSARAVFRAVAWSGEPPEQSTKPEPPVSLDVRAVARQVFASIPWTGEEAEAPTSHQINHSVRVMLDAFQWE
ncbi:MAG: hypothetical protein AAGF11_19890 [Myxococcota bacterium]